MLSGVPHGLVLGPVLICYINDMPEPAASSIYMYADNTKIWLVGGSPCFAPSRQISPLWVEKCGPTAPKIAKIGIFWYTCAQKGYTPLSDFYKIWFGGRESQVRTLIPNFTVLALKMWAYSRKNRENFAYKFAIVSKFWGSTEKVEYRCTTTNLPACNDTIIVEVITAS